MPLVANLFRRVGDAVCTTDWAQRLRIGRSLLAAAIHAGCLTITNAAAYLGLADPAQAKAATVIVCCGVFGFYVALRSGWNRRLADPALTFAQLLFAVAAIMLYYAMLAPIRSAMLLVMCQTLAFGMFSLTTQQARRLAACTAVGIAARRRSWPRVGPRSTTRGSRSSTSSSSSRCWRSSRRCRASSGNFAPTCASSAANSRGHWNGSRRWSAATN